MNANPVPLQLQLPMKYFSSFSFGFGPGGASAARSWEAAKARAITRNVALFIEFSPFGGRLYRSRPLLCKSKTHGGERVAWGRDELLRMQLGDRGVTFASVAVGPRRPD